MPRTPPRPFPRALSGRARTGSPAHTSPNTHHATLCMDRVQTALIRPPWAPYTAAHGASPTDSPQDSAPPSAFPLSTLHHGKPRQHGSTTRQQPRHASTGRNRPQQPQQPQPSPHTSKASHRPGSTAAAPNPAAPGAHGHAHARVQEEGFWVEEQTGAGAAVCMWRRPGNPHAPISCALMSACRGLQRAHNHAPSP